MTKTEEGEECMMGVIRDNREGRQVMTRGVGQLASRCFEFLNEVRNV